MSDFGRLPNDVTEDELVDDSTEPRLGRWNDGN